MLSTYRNRYRLLIGLLLIGLFLAIFLSVRYAGKTLEYAQLQEARRLVLDNKKSFIRDTVHNVIDIIALRDHHARQRFSTELQRLADLLEHWPEPTTATARMLLPSVADPEQQSWAVWETGRNTPAALHHAPEAAGRPDTLAPQSPHQFTQTLKESRQVVLSDGLLVLGYTEAAVRDAVTREIGDYLRNMEFEQDSYVWVNEVLDYAGGENYAVRRIHPGQPRTEGQLLSTSTPDLAGNLPYAEELEGVKKGDGHYFSYYFRKRDSEEISEKLSYAALYRPYNWVVAMGVHYDDIESLTRQTQAAQKAAVDRLRIRLLLIAAILVATLSALFIWLERWYERHFNRLVARELYRDPLTGALNRRAADRDLNQRFDTWRHDGVNTAVYLLDLDDFKRVNDTWGHDVGDAVLASVVQALKASVRQSDTVYRWGGEELLVLCQGMQARQAEAFGQVLLQAMHDLRLPVSVAEEAARAVNVTASVGISLFAEEDTNAREAVQRADQAMYEAKEQGKDRVVSRLPEQPENARLRG